MDKITKRETKAWAKGLQCLYDREARRNEKRRLRMSGQRNKSWTFGVLGVKWGKKYFREERVFNSVKSTSFKIYI